MSFRRTLPLALAATMVLVAPATAAEYKPFDRATFNAAQAQGRPILVFVHAWWCPVCASQDKTIKATAIMPDYAKLLVLRINYDAQKPEWQSFNVQKQSTLIAFRGGKELGRVSYITDKATIQALLAKTKG